ncbi:MAG: M23 family metallopeptidase [Deltaproteobacteria bacterium]|nr:M23 family metallopeptidase [Deltaproteobacteria bacterium]
MPRSLTSLPFLLVLCGCELVGAPSPVGGPGDLSDAAEPPVASSAPAVCAPVLALECGQNATGDTADWNSGATQVMAHYPVGVGTFDGPEVVYSFTAPASGEVRVSLVDPEPMAVDHDLFLLEEVCEPDHAVETGFNSMPFAAMAGQTYFLVVDGYDGAAGAFEISLSCEADAALEAPDPPLADVPCDAFHSSESESAPIQTTGASLPPSVADASWALPTTWTNWVDFNGEPGHGAQHEGIDWIHADPSLPVIDVHAASDGVIAYVRSGCPESSRFGHNDSHRECGGGWGNHVVVDHGEGVFTRYAHLAEDDIEVTVGETVSIGRRIGGMGNSGRSEERHLHFELGTSEEPLDPCSAAQRFDAVYPSGALF